jgi:large subunit ribosomal protein L5
MKDERITKPLNIIYTEQIIETLNKKFNFQNKHQVPKLIKIQINRGLGIDAQNSTILKKSVEEFRILTGQHPTITKAKKSIASFKVRENMNIGVTVTLRKQKMYCFLEKLIHLVLPRIRDFRGLSSKGFDRNGNFNFGLHDQLVFPEMNYDMIDQTRGLNISIVTSAKTKEQGYALLKEFDFPLIE